MKLEVPGEGSESAVAGLSNPHQPGVKGEGERTGREKEKEVWSPAMRDMMDGRGDFPPRSHPLTRW